MDGLSTNVLQDHLIFSTLAMAMSERVRPVPLLLLFREQYYLGFCVRITPTMEAQRSVISEDLTCRRDDFVWELLTGVRMELRNGVSRRRVRPGVAHRVIIVLQPNDLRLHVIVSSVSQRVNGLARFMLRNRSDEVVLDVSAVQMDLRCFPIYLVRMVVVDCEVVVMARLSSNEGARPIRAPRVVRVNISIVQFLRFKRSLFRRIKVSLGRDPISSVRAVVKIRGIR